MNENKSLDNMLWVFLPYVAKLISNIEKIDLKAALDFIYHSKTYRMLEDKECKMWYYPDGMLAEFFVNEYEKNRNK